MADLEGRLVDNQSRDYRPLEVSCHVCLHNIPVQFN